VSGFAPEVVSEERGVRDADKVHESDLLTRVEIAGIGHE
jgi:hypothetical protein